MADIATTLLLLGIFFMACSFVVIYGIKQLKKRLWR